MNIIKLRTFILILNPLPYKCQAIIDRLYKGPANIHELIDSVYFGIHKNAENPNDVIRNQIYLLRKRWKFKIFNAGWRYYLGEKSKPFNKSVNPITKRS